MKISTSVFLCLGFLTIGVGSQAQKTPLTHAVYDQWQSVQAKNLSNDGAWIVYNINPQEGDGEMVIQSTDGRYRKSVPRGYMQDISEDSKYVVFKIKPPFQLTRQARIKKKRPDDMPKDSIGFLELGRDSIFKTARVKTFKMPEKGLNWFAYHMEKSLSDTTGRSDTSARTRRSNPAVDSLQKVIDSLNNRINTGGKKKKIVDGDDKDASSSDADEDPLAGGPAAILEGTDLMLFNTATNKRIRFPYIAEYYFDKSGKSLILSRLPPKKDSLARPSVLWYDLATGKTDTISRGANEYKYFAIDEEGSQLAFLAERDSSGKALRKIFKLWYFQKGMDSARLKASSITSGMPDGYTVSENAIPLFSKDGKRLFIGTSLIPKVKDTTLVDFEMARLDIWSYKDDYLQSQQLKQMPRDLKNSYLAVINLDDNRLVQLGNKDINNVITADQGNAGIALGMSDKGFRAQSQWTGRALQTAYLIDITTGSKKLIKEKINGFFALSPKGKFVFWYDQTNSNYFAYNTTTAEIKNITSGIKTPLFDEDDDHPDFPPPHGFVKWMEDDSYIFIYDKYDIWKVDPLAKTPPICITNGLGRKTKHIYRNVTLGLEDRSFKPEQVLLLTNFNEEDKTGSFRFYQLGTAFDQSADANKTFPLQDLAFVKAKNANVYAYSKATVTVSNLYVARLDSTGSGAGKKYAIASPIQLSDINRQQQKYNWMTSELVHWKMFDGKPSQGMLFKPEDFDPKKTYPIIFYFYEKSSDELFAYKAPAPSASTINIPYFVSNGYIVFVPDIYYTRKGGQPGEDSYNAVGSAAKFFGSKPWIDSTKMGIQGQSWGGYQVAYLVTRTNMFAAAGAGAAVVNMTSAYGGIRWGPGINRQFQYEKGQSRIGASLWAKPELYIKNSPLFKLDKVKTPLLLMQNDADGSVPWYQGIEFFTALKRLGKKAWMLEYNGEDHNLVERRNRKDLSVRLSQFFDFYLKGAKSPKWMSEGLPAVEKGSTWALEVDGDQP